MGTLANSTEILNSWKEIAAYLNRGVRTIQRWEADLGLPIRRPRHKQRSAVLAMRSEIDHWLRSVPLTEKGRIAVNQVLPPMPDPGAWRFLMSEIAFGLTFANIAMTARPNDHEKIERNVSNARRAYGAVMKFRHRVLMDKEATAQFNAGLSRLEEALEELDGLGQICPPRDWVDMCWRRQVIRAGNLRRAFDAPVDAPMA